MKKTCSFFILFVILGSICCFAASGPICKESPCGKTVYFTADEFKTAFTGGELAKIRLSVLPESYRGTVKLNGKPLKELSEIPVEKIKKLTFVPQKGVTGSIVFLWNGAPAFGEFSSDASTVTIFIRAEEKVTETAVKEGKNNSFISKLFGAIKKRFGKRQTAA